MGTQIRLVADTVPNVRETLLTWMMIESDRSGFMIPVYLEQSGITSCPFKFILCFLYHSNEAGRFQLDDWQSFDVFPAFRMPAEPIAY
jgi:hypothetical protein